MTSRVSAMARKPESERISVALAMVPVYALAEKEIEKRARENKRKIAMDKQKKEREMKNRICGVCYSYNQTRSTLLSTVSPTKLLLLTNHIPSRLHIL